MIDFPIYANKAERVINPNRELPTDGIARVD